MSEVVIKAENISKQYRLGLVGTGTVRDDLKRWSYRIRGKEDPFLKIGEVNDRTVKGNGDYVWSLKDINFEIEQGDAVGIIGRNGAGKSTLLKILSQVTQPTTGKIYTKGRIASLLEVGTGFHPEMTGRENIYLNGAILGMRKSEINRKFDEIVDFSGVERYIDTPVKRYSSGMYVRLAFAVAAHLESEILIVDEVLAVGDAEFQKKCLGKIGDVTKGEGRTVLFVSHNMSAIKNLCNKGILLEHGKVIFTSDTESVVNHYLTNSSQVKDTSLIDRTDRKGNGAIRVIGIDLINQKNKLVEQVISGDWLKIRLNLSTKLATIDYSKLFVGVALHDMEERRVVSFFSDEMGTDFTKFDDNNYIDLIVPKFNLRGGLYDLTFQLGLGSSRAEDCIDVVEKAMGIEVLQGDFWKSGKLNRLGNYVLLDASYE